MSSLPAVTVIFGNLATLPSTICVSLQSLDETYVLGLFAHADTFEGNIESIKPRI